MATAVVHLLVGLVLLALAISGVAVLGAGGWAALVWAVPTLCTTGLAARSATPARPEDDQGWNAYVLRAVLVGGETVRPVPVRIVTGLVLGGPLGFLVLVYAVLEAISGLGV